jgi:hypothetical protein
MCVKVKKGYVSPCVIDSVQSVVLLFLAGAVCCRLLVALGSHNDEQRFSEAAPFIRLGLWFSRIGGCWGC